uniref:Uncharacterized protein n=1 Tax=Rhizophora mucronata TaxID=61149 RepID=A0A2P2IXI1_RHIMU
MLLGKVWLSYAHGCEPLFLITRQRPRSTSLGQLSVLLCSVLKRHMRAILHGNACIDFSILIGVNC